MHAFLRPAYTKSTIFALLNDKTFNIRFDNHIPLVWGPRVKTLDESGPTIIEVLIRVFKNQGLLDIDLSRKRGTKLKPELFTN